MGISSYSTTPASNTAISGIGIQGSNVISNFDNAFRQLMADLAEWYASGGGGSGQPLDATLTALAALVVAAGDMIYATGSDAFATTPSTSFGRSLLNTADASAARTLLDSSGSGGISGTGGTSWSYSIGVLTFACRTFTIAANTTTTFAFGNGHTYASWANAWMSGNDDAGDVSVGLQSNGLTTATIFNNDDGSVSGQLFSVGI